MGHYVFIDRNKMIKSKKHLFEQSGKYDIEFYTMDFDIFLSAYEERENTQLLLFCMTIVTLALNSKYKCVSIAKALYFS